MKITLIATLISFLISLPAIGQQPQDTLFLKNGSKAGGKLLRKSKKEYRFQISNGAIFTVPTDEVEKFIPGIVNINTIIRNADPDTLTNEENNLYKAIKMRNTGRALTLGGIGVAAGGVIAATAFTMSTGGDEPGAVILGGLSVIVGGISTLIGIPRWVKGAKRKAEAELTLQKFTLTPEGSMALGLGITIRF